MKNYCAVILCCLLGIGCTFHCDELNEPVPIINTQNLPPLAAEFVTTISGDDSTVNSALIVRTASAVEWIYLTSNASELWTKTSNDLWFYSKVFHADRQVIEYSPVDINLLGIHQQWQQLAINPDILHAAISTKPAADFRGWQSVIYTGKVEGITYEVLWLPQLSIAARVIAKQGKQKTVTEIRMLYINQQAPFTFSDITHYRTIEYTDLGDMERDPFVMKIQHELLDHHGHLH
jgi:hypothetical protein